MEQVSRNLESTFTTPAQLDVLRRMLAMNEGDARSLACSGAKDEKGTLGTLHIARFSQ